MVHSIYIYIYIYTHHLFNGHLSRTTRVSRYQKGKTNLDFTPCTIKKEPHILVRRKQTSAYKLVQLSSFTGFCWCCWLAVLKYVVRLIFFANNDVKNCVIIYRLPRKGDGRSAQARDTRLHPAHRHFGLQIIHTSTRSITRYGAFFSSGCTAGKSKMWTSCDSASLRNGIDVFALVWLRRADVSSKWYNVPIWQYLLYCMTTLKFHFCQMWYDF